MRKRVDHDATQEVSSSQLVPDAKPPVYPTVPKNDASMWLSAPVSADDFVGAPKKKPGGSGGRGIVVGLTAVALLAVTGGGVWYAFLREQPKQTSAFDPKPASAPAPAPASAPDPAAVAADASDAGVAVAAADAAVQSTGETGAAGAALQVDAVSAADPAMKKPTKKRASTKKKGVKKKAAAKRR